MPTHLSFTYILLYLPFYTASFPFLHTVTNLHTATAKHLISMARKHISMFTFLGAAPPRSSHMVSTFMFTFLGTAPPRSSSSSTQLSPLSLTLAHTLPHIHTLFTHSLSLIHPHTLLSLHSRLLSTHRSCSSSHSQTLDNHKLHFPDPTPFS